jgi:transcriptional regulator with XRE-family HTH domain
MVAANNRLVFFMHRAYFKLRPMPTDEKIAFTKRLKLALKRSNKKITTPAELALQFNLRHPNESVSPQAVHKWLTGKAKPTTDKIATLADWLTVSPHWLSFGSAAGEQLMPDMRQNKTHKNTPAALSDSELNLLVQMRRLSTHQQSIIAELVEQLAAEWNV